MRILKAVTILVLGCGIALAQDAQDAPEAAVNQAQPAYSPVSGSPRSDVPPQTSVVTEIPRNSFQIGVDAQSAYNDQGGSFAASDAGYIVNVSPVFRLSNSREKSATTLEYRPSFYHTTGISNRDQFGQDFFGKGAWKLSNRWSLQMQNSFVVTSDPFYRATGRSIAESSNTTVVTPFVWSKSEAANAELDFAASKRTTVGAVGNFNMQRYNDLSGVSDPNRQLLESTTSAGRAFVRHWISKTVAAGLEYDYQDLFVGKDYSRVQSHSVVAFTTLNLGRHSSVTLYGGPQRSHLRNTVVLDFGLGTITFAKDEWQTSPTAGASYLWRGKHTSFTASYDRNISDGGGIMGAVRLQEVAASFQHDFSREWSAQAGFTYGNNQALAHEQNVMETYTGSLSMVRKITRDFSVAAYFAHSNRNETIQFPTNSYNQIGLSLQYLWTSPLGR